MTPRDWVVILDFGSQYTKLIARRMREIGVFSRIEAPDWKPDGTSPLPGAVVLSGGPQSVYDPAAPRPHPSLWSWDLPVLGICYGMQWMAHDLGGRVEKSPAQEYGPAELHILEANELFANLPQHFRVWMSHGDRVEALPPGFEVLAATEDTPIAAMGDTQRRRYGLQFHPEVSHTQFGRQILQNFLTRVAGMEPSWDLEDFVGRTIASIREQVGDRGVMLALSGGVDSSVLAALLHRAIPDQLYAVFVDTGLLKWDEPARIRKLFGHLRHLTLLDERERFFRVLQGVVDPEEKRKRIGHTFIEVFRAYARQLPGNVAFLAQGTLYPDVIESGHSRGPAEVIKSHHNVGGLPEEIGFALLEPFRELFKDEVREIGRILGLPQDVLERHPFPGPGFAVRIVGEVTPERVARIQKADRILEEEARRAGIYSSLWQLFPVLLPVQSVGVMGDRRTYQDVMVLRAVESTDGMTARWSYLPETFLERIARRWTGEVPGVNRVVLDITSKPPATIEWE